MIYENKELNTIGEIFDKALSLAKKDKQKALDFLDAYATYVQEANNISKEEALEIAKSNFGYFAGYFDDSVRKIIYDTYQAAHPIFGNASVTSEQAYEMGKNYNKK